jgi:hypothetical protein
LIETPPPRDAEGRASRARAEEESSHDLPGPSGRACAKSAYSHVLPGMGESAASTVASLILGGEATGETGRDKPLTSRRQAPARGEEVKCEPAVQAG